MSGAAMNYDFGHKRHWRRWVWNRIAERVENRRDALCIYLPGSSDFDRPLAISRGFRDVNLIGVERNPDSLRTLRKSGALTINADFIETVTATIISKRMIGVIYGDLCCGLTRKLLSHIIVWLAATDSTKNCVFAFNLMRGRDAESNAIRGALNDGGPLVQNSELEISEKHRGVALFSQAVFMMVHLSTYHRPGISAEDCEAELEAQPELMALINKRFMAMVENSKLDAESYRSDSGQVFDTVVFRHPLHSKLDGFSTQSSRLTDALRVDPFSGKASRRLAAVMAHRTMRMN